MSLHHTLAYDPPAARRLRRCAPLLLVVSLTALALAPGLITGDGPFQASLCGASEQGPEACTQLARAAMPQHEPDLAEPALGAR